MVIRYRLNGECGSRAAEVSSVSYIDGVAEFILKDGKYNVVFEDVEAEAYEDIIDKLSREGYVDLCDCKYYCYHGCCDEPPKADTAVHSKWIQMPRDYCKCEHCDCMFFIASDYGDKNFCPNCGAIMDQN